MDYLRAILTAHLDDIARVTPLTHAERLSQSLGNEVLLKREDLQEIFSFKIRGAANKLRQLSPAERDQGVIAASAGNHAQGVALAARRMQVAAVIVMPLTTPPIKIDAVRRLGAEVMLHGDNFDQALAFALDLAQQRQLVFLHPYDDPAVIAGQGTVAVELARQAGDHLDAVFVPVGGGGLLAGMTAYLRAIRPEVEVIGVEPADAASCQAALQAGHPVVLPEVGLFADGVAVARMGDHTWGVIKDHVSQVVTVDTDGMCAAVKDVFEATRVLAEPAGALAVAGLKQHCQQQGWHGKRVAAVVSGANLNFDRLRHIAERTDLGAGNEIILGVVIPEQPGSFRRLTQHLSHVVVSEFNYRHQPGPEAKVFIGLRSPIGGEQHRQVQHDLSAAGYHVVDLTADEVAKLHGRHLIGGSCQHAAEQVYRIEFPERPGALTTFLDQLGDRFDISLFHYRNHGTDYGRVLIAFAADTQQATAIEKHLQHTGYNWQPASDSASYQFFLS